MAVTAGEASRVVGCSVPSMGVALAGALASLVVRTRGTLPFLLITPFWLVHYPISPLIGYDLATRGAGPDDGTPLRTGGYSVAVAAAHAAMALVWPSVSSPRWTATPLSGVLYALCVAPAIPATTAAVRQGRRLHVPPGALLGASIAVISSPGWPLS